MRALLVSFLLAADPSSLGSTGAEPGVEEGPAEAREEEEEREEAREEERARALGLVRRTGLLYIRVAPGFLGLRLDDRGGAGYLYGVAIGGARMMRTRGYSYMIGGRFTHRISRIEIGETGTAEIEHWFHAGLEFRPGYRQGRLFAFGLLTPSLLVELRKHHPTRPDGTYVGAGIGVGAGLIGWVSERLFVGSEAEFIFDGFFAAEGAEFRDRWTQHFQWFVMFGWAL